MAGCFELLLTREQRPSETEFVAVGVNQVEEALTPLGIAGCGGWLARCCERTFIECINIGDVGDNAAPPGPAPLRRLRDEVKRSDFPGSMFHEPIMPIATPLKLFGFCH
jgi:hypothetical protein